MCNTTVINWLYSIVYTGILPGNAWEEAYNTSTLRPHSNLYYTIYPFRTIHHLGSGQFGTVDRGEWTTQDGQSVDVAIKSLKCSVSEEEQIRFLQEAAISGQFHHSNVLQLLGVVTDGHPVSCQLKTTKLTICNYVKCFVCVLYLILYLFCRH